MTTEEAVGESANGGMVKGVGRLASEVLRDHGGGRGGFGDKCFNGKGFGFGGRGFGFANSFDDSSLGNHWDRRDF